MSYLVPKEYKSISDTVSILSVSSLSREDISQYSFDCGKAKDM